MRAFASFVAFGAGARAHVAATTLELNHVIPDAGVVYASTEVEIHGSGYAQAYLPPLGCRFGEVVVDKDASSSTSEKIECPNVTSALAGFVAVGIAQYTNRRYVPGADDVVVSKSLDVSFEFVKPWKLTWVNPEYVYKSGGETLRLTGQHFRPGMQCTFVESSLTSEFRFVSSALATCETRVSSESTGTVDLSLTPAHAVGGTTAGVDYQVAPIIDGPVESTSAIGSDVTIQASNSASFNGATASFTASPVRIGCWFNGIWVEATLVSTRALKCTTPNVVKGDVSLSVMDMYSQRMFPTNSSQTGWFTTFSVLEGETIDHIIPEIGSAMRSSPADSSTLIEFYGDALIAGSRSIAARICKTLNPETLPVLLPVLVTGQSRSKCDFPTEPSETVALETLTYGFHAVLQGVVRYPGTQFQIVSPPQVTSVVPGFLREATIATFSGQNLKNEWSPTKCTFDGTSSDAYVISSAILRCIIPLYADLPLGSSTSAHTIVLGVTFNVLTSAAGVSSIAWVPIASNLASITPSVGATSGGTRTVLKLSGETIPTASYYTPSCRFGTIVTSAIHVPGGGVACTSPAHVSQNVTVGIDEESAVEFQYVPDIVVTSVSPPALPQTGGFLSVYLESALSYSYSAECVFVTSGGDKVKTSLAVDANDGVLKCEAPETGIGFATMAVVFATTSMNNTAFIDEAAGNYVEIEVRVATPSVDIFLPTGANWVYAEDVIHVTTSDGSLLSGSAEFGGYVCSFIRAAQSGGSVYVSTATKLSAAMLKCEVPDMDTLVPAAESGFEVLVSICTENEFLVGQCTSLAGTRLRYEKKMNVTSISPVNGTEAGGDLVVLVDSATIKGFGANVPSCRFGTIYPVSASGVIGVSAAGELQCTTPAHVAGIVPVSVPPLGIGFAALTFTYTTVGTTQSDVKETMGNDPYVSATLTPPNPMITEVSPWVGWSGTVITLTGTHLPIGPDVKCKFGAVSVDAQVVSTALIRCGTIVPVTAYDVEEQLVAVTTSTGDDNPNVTAISHYVTTRGDILEADATDGWQQGGNTVHVSIAKWVPEGYTTCLFGTISVQSRGGDGYGAIGKASLSRLSQWWSDSTDGTEIECVSPAQGPGTVEFGVSISGSTIKSYNGTTFTYI